MNKLVTNEHWREWTKQFGPLHPKESDQLNMAKSYAMDFFDHNLQERLDETRARIDRSKFSYLQKMQMIQALIMLKESCSTK